VSLETECQREFARRKLNIALGLAALFAQKNRAKRRSPFRPIFLQAGDVRGLQALGAGGNLELNRLPFVQRLISLRLNRGEMNEDVLAGLALDESVALAGVEPLHCSLFFHCYYLALGYLRSSFRPAYLAGWGAGPGLPLARRNKRLQDVTNSPLNELKGITRATNAGSFYQKVGFIV